MNTCFLTQYSVKGIKALDHLITLSFYKKNITKDLNIRDYNTKGIYGMNGSGKTAIIDSVKILKNLLNNPDYLNNPLVQKNLDAIINKKNEELFIEAEFILRKENPLLYRYNITLGKSLTGKYVITHESLAYKKAAAKGDSLTLVFEVGNGDIEYLIEEKGTEDIVNEINNKTKNLLLTAPLSELWFEKIFIENYSRGMSVSKDILTLSLLCLNAFETQVYVYLEQPDDHQNYMEKVFLRNYIAHGVLEKGIEHLKDYRIKINNEYLLIMDTSNVIRKEDYGEFEKEVKKLNKFLHVFKPELKKIEIDKKEDQDVLYCDLIMNYGSYRIHGEYESTGIKKLIKLYTYIEAAVDGSIVFIDELDANLHDVYLCALLVYFMEYGKGQLCFTTHNVGPMDILKGNKKSIDFLSENHRIYSWKTNGNYSPSRLYRNGMIEGSPFNVDSIDFIGTFSCESEEE